MPYGDNYARFFADDGGWVPFPNPANDGQRVENARVRARRAGIDIGAGRLDPDGVLRNPNADHWYSDPRVIGPLAVGAAGALPAFFGGAAAGPAAATSGSGTLASNGLSIVPPAAGGAGTAAIPSGAAVATGATTAGGITGTTAAGTSALEALRRTFTSPHGVASLAALIPSLIATANGGGSNSGTTNEELRRIQGITEARMRRADPLHQVAVQLAYDRAPISARRNTALQTVPLP